MLDYIVINVPISPIEANYFTTKKNVKFIFVTLRAAFPFRHPFFHYKNAPTFPETIHFPALPMQKALGSIETS